MENKIQRFDHLTVTHLIFPEGELLEAIADKGMNLNISIEDNEIWISNETERLLVEFKVVKQ